MCLLRAVPSFVDDGKHIPLKPGAAVYSIPVSARSNIIPVAWGPKIAFQPAVSWHLLGDHKASFPHAFLQSHWNNGSLHCRALFH